MTLPALRGSATPIPALAAASDLHARLRFLEFFASAIRNPHTKRAYLRAVNDFLGWCETVAVPSVVAVQPLHVASWIELQTRERSAPTVSCAWPRCATCSTGWSPAR